MGLSFGTGGIRALMGPGLDRMNEETVALATEGFARVLKKHNQKSLRVAISYDSRHQSRLFAEIAAHILAMHGIHVFITTELRPTPYLSFLCRHHNCAGGIMITASHNPPEYNGYKVYWRGGRQVTAPYDQEIVDAVKQSQLPIKIPSHSPLIHWIGPEEDRAYLKAIETQKGEGGASLKIAYTSLHGTGTPLMQKALASWGFECVYSHEKQCIPDGDFPTAKNPNPETDAALELGIELLKEKHADLLLATDPDADRLGAALLHKGKPYHFSGDEIATLLLDHLLKTRPIPPNGVVISTIVTTRLLEKMAKAHGLTYVDVLIGFKYIAEQIEKEEGSFLFGAEQSLGYLYGNHARDKDGLISGCLLAEAAERLKREGKTLLDQLQEIHKRYGVHIQLERSLTLTTSEMAHWMERLRADPPEVLASQEVVCVRDYLDGVGNLPKADILSFELEGGFEVIVRPSGTEPKIKLYARGSGEGAHPILEGILNALN